MKTKSLPNEMNQVPLFSGLSKSEIKALKKLMTAVNINSGKTVVREGDVGREFMIIRSGTASVSREGNTFAQLGPGDFFGEMSLLDGEGRSANIVSNEDSEVLTLSRSDFLDCLETYPKIAIALLEELAIRLRKSDQHIESLSLSDSEHRIAITLIRFAQELGTIKKGEVTIKNLPFQQDIANMAGTSRETVSRTIKLLEEKNLVKKKKKDLIIFNFDEFRQLFS